MARHAAREELTVHSRRSDGELIRRRMARIRRHRHENVRKVIARADSFAGWARGAGGYGYTWAALGATAATVAVVWMAGGRRRVTPMEPIVLASEGQPSVRQSVMNAAAGFFAKVAVRAAQNYAAHCFEEWIGSRPAATMTNETIAPPDHARPRADECRGRPETAPGESEVLQSIVISEGSNNA